VRTRSRARLPWVPSQGSATCRSRRSGRASPSLLRHRCSGVAARGSLLGHRWSGIAALGVAARDREGGVFRRDAAVRILTGTRSAVLVDPRIGAWSLGASRPHQEGYGGGTALVDASRRSDPFPFPFPFVQDRAAGPSPRSFPRFLASLPVRILTAHGAREGHPREGLHTTARRGSFCAHAGPRNLAPRLSFSALVSACARGTASREEASLLR
jgi:hypothetical protein